MKIGVLTQPLMKNYGGILQAYALQQILLRFGHEVIIINRVDNYPSIKLLFWRIASMIKCIISKYFRGNNFIRVVNPLSPEYITDTRLCYDYENLKCFIAANINLSREIRSSRRLRKYILKNKVECIVVGSDQIWREEYSPCITDFFGGFITSRDNIRIISYAASFGLEKIPIAPDKQLKCRDLLKRFNAVSVREKTALDLLSKEWGIDAEVTLDPTLLLEKLLYEKLIKKPITIEPGIFCYLLDESNEKMKITQDVSEMLSMNTSYVFLYPKNDSGYAGRLESMSDWLCYISNSRYVVTDSYHGCVFSIIFNKPFIVLANHKRGIDRFTTLLDLVGLRNRMIHSREQLTKSLIEEQIDYSRVNNILNLRKIECLNYLKRSLCI